ncbi:hypothetical protein GCM10027089_48790 [Nocardia thraciensis]
MRDRGENHGINPGDARRSTVPPGLIGAGSLAQRRSVDPNGYVRGVVDNAGVPEFLNPENPGNVPVSGSDALTSAA